MSSSNVASIQDADKIDFEMLVFQIINIKSPEFFWQPRTNLNFIWTD